MNWKALALTATLSFAIVGDTAQARDWKHGRRNRIVVPSIQVGVNGPIVTPGVRIGNTVISPQIRPQPTFPPRRTIFVPQPLNPYPVIPTYPTFPTYPTYPAPVRPFTSERSLERSIENDIRARFGRAVDDVDVDVDFDDSEVEINVDVDNRRFAPAIRSYVQLLRARELAGFRRVRLDIDD